MSHYYQVVYEGFGGELVKFPPISGALTASVDDAGILYFTDNKQRVVFMFNNDVWKSVERVERLKATGGANELDATAEETHTS